MLLSLVFLSLLGFALGIAVEILFALLQSKKIGTKSPLERPKTTIQQQSKKAIVSYSFSENCFFYVTPSMLPL